MQWFPRNSIGLMTAAILSFAVLTPLGAQDNPIVRRMDAFAIAYNAGDAKAIAAFYAEDGVLLPPGSKMVVGAGPIEAHYASAFAQGASDLRFRILEIRQAGADTAVEIGETEVKVGSRTIVGRYLHVWTRQGDIWSISRDMYHVIGATE